MTILNTHTFEGEDGSHITIKRVIPELDVYKAWFSDESRSEWTFIGYGESGSAAVVDLYQCLQADVDAEGYRP